MGEDWYDAKHISKVKKITWHGTQKESRKYTNDERAAEKDLKLWRFETENEYEARETKWIKE